jgi:hypothetical protein
MQRRRGAADFAPFGGPHCLVLDHNDLNFIIAMRHLRARPLYDVRLACWTARNDTAIHLAAGSFSSLC